jgi:hypothetical protein
MELAAEGDADVTSLLELTGSSPGALHQARGRCLAALQSQSRSRPSDRRTLLQALELVDHALDRLELR